MNSSHMKKTNNSRWLYILPYSNNHRWCCRTFYSIEDSEVRSMFSGCVVPYFQTQPSICYNEGNKRYIPHLYRSYWTSCRSSIFFNSQSKSRRSACDYEAFIKLPESLQCIFLVTPESLTDYNCLKGINLLPAFIFVDIFNRAVWSFKN